MFELSAVQQDIWLAERLLPALPRFNMQLAARLTGDVSVERVRTAVERVSLRYPVLHSRFVASNDGPRRLVDAVTPLLLPIGSAPDIAAVRRQAAADLSAAFDIETGPLLRGRMITAGRETYLLLTAHHLVADAASGIRLLTEIGAVYAGDEAPGEDPGYEA